MAQDYVVQLGGKDNLTPVLKNAKEATSQLASSFKGLDKVSERFKKIESSAQPLQRKIKEIQKLMSELNMSGDSNSPLYNQMAAAAGRYKDAVADAARATRQFSSDTMSLEAATSAIQGIAAAGSVATGVMGMLGVENDKVAQALLKVQSAMAILNGVQTLANVLNKDSVLVLKMKQIAQAASSAATTGDTTATVANTGATIANTAANKASTVATKAWNVVKAISKALLGDFTGLLIVGAGALATYAIATSDSTDEVKQLNDEKEKAKNIEEELENVVVTSCSNMWSSYEDLRIQYINLKTEHEKIQWIKNNEDAFRKLGIVIKDVSTAEKVFVKYTDKMMLAMLYRAQAAGELAKIDKITEDTVKKLNDNDKKLKVDKTVTPEQVKKEYKGNKFRMLPDEFQQSGLVQGLDFQIVVTDNDSYYEVFDSGFAKVANYRGQQANVKSYQEHKKEEKAIIDNYQKAVKPIYNKINQLYKEAESLYKEVGVETVTTTVDKTTHTPKSTPKTKSTPKPKQTPKSTTNTVTKLTEEQQNELNEIKKEIYETQDEWYKGLRGTDDAAKRIKELSQKAKKIDPKFHELELDTLSDDLNKVYDGLAQGASEAKQMFDRGIIDEQMYKDIIDIINSRFDERGLGENAVRFEYDLTPQINPDSLKGLQDQLQDATNELSLLGNSDADKERIAELLHIIDNLQKQIEQKEIELKLKPALNTIDIEKYNKEENPATANKRISHQNANTIVEQLKEDVKLGITGADEALEIINEINEKLTELGLKPIVIKVENGQLKTQADILQDTQTLVGDVTSTIGSMSQAMQSLGEKSAVAKAGLIAGAIGSIVASFAQVMLAESKSLWTWIAAAASGMATIAGVVSQIKSFADGGIIQGSTFHGDNMIARVNAGEMILNKKQQGNLFRLLDSGAVNNGVTVSEVKLRGSDIYMLLKNYNNKMKKIR